MSAIHELRFAARQLRRTPGVTAAAVLTLALAIGANTAVFSAVRAVLLRPLPFRAAERLVVIWGKQPGSPFPRLPLSYPDFADLRAQTRTLADVAAWTSSDQSRAAITGAGDPFEVLYGVATTNLFRVLGVRAAAGRTLSLDERAAAAGAEVLVSHRLWSRFGLDRRLIGSTLRLDGKPCTVVGVLPAAFRFGNARVDVWMPTLLDPAGSGPRSRMYARGAKYLGVVARRAAGVAPAAVQAELAAIAARLAHDEPYFDRDLGLEPVPLREQVVGGRRPTLWLLLGAVGAVLLVGCANLAHLQLARAAQRRQELALRGALGAGRLRLARQLFAESFLLAAAGGALGVLLAAGGLRLLPLLGGESESILAPFLVAAGEVRLDPQVLAF
ncbi:MAG TPA: ABC transporter permease, partial [Thermoanaerobaculia bacterium]|nr:ABC transporter permease [Thermoanaerobaculia bacterium]